MFHLCKFALKPTAFKYCNNTLNNQDVCPLKKKDIVGYH